MSSKDQYCCAYKNKKESIQCTYKSKGESRLCGKHQKAKIIFNDKIIISSLNPITNNLLTTTTTIDYVCFENKENNTPQQKLLNRNQNTIDNILTDDLLYNCPIKSNKNDILNAKILIKKIENTNNYIDYLNTRKNYVKESPKYIELLEFIENDKLDNYPISRITSSLEHYKLISTNKSSGPKFVVASQNIPILKNFFSCLLKAFHHTSQIIKIQQFTKKHLKHFNIKIRGPALENRSMCVNDSDFYTLDPINEINNDDFISFTDEKNFTYGFHIESLIELTLKSDETYYENFKKNNQNIAYRPFIRTLFNHYNKIKIINPYTRTPINSDIKLNIIRIFAQRKFKDINPIISDPIVIDYKTQVRNKCLAVFQKLDFMGYSTDINWLFDQNIKVLKKFYKKMSLIWNFEFGLTQENRYKISKRYDLFNNLHEMMISKLDKYSFLDKVLDALNCLVSNGDTDGERNSGGILILYGLASITPDCARANPWLS